MKNKPELKRASETALTIIGLAVLYAGLLSFLFLNEQLISLFPLLAAAFCFLTVAAASVLLVSAVKDKKINGKKGKALSIAALIAAAAELIVLILFTLVVRMFQPLTLSTETAVVLIVGVVLLLTSSALGLAFGTRSASQIVLPVFAVILMTTGVIWAECQPYAAYENIDRTETYLFSNGEDGYYTFRIPSLIALDKDVLNEKYGFTLEYDMLLATAEARESSRDVGDIDVVGKYSIDNGQNWSGVFLLFEVKGEKGKCGNPTPVFDKVNGVLNFVYQYATAASGYDYRTVNVQGTLNADYTFTFGEPILLNEDLSDNVTLGAADGVNENTLMAGPGKGIQLSSGRLLIPCSNCGEAFALISDDYGLTWRRGASAGEGNECEIAALQNGELIMVVRSNSACYLSHTKQYLRFAYSDDNGESWHLKASESTLKTPICMASVASSVDGGTLFCTYPNSFTARADLTLGVSVDGGASWQTKLLYDGASGYSCSVVTSDGTLFVLAEVGKVNYNEALVLLCPTT